MGSNASKGSDNDELVDNLLKDQYLKTPSIQQIFRAVDRGLYFTKRYRQLAYDDTAWRNGNIHLSAPGIYCEVLENLELGEGMSFLNLGSGTGYLNTMAGLILGSYGVNYGVEVHKDVIDYAYKKLEKFKRNAEAIDEYDFCEPKFFEGNCLHLSSENRLYDRVYCGAACPPTYENYMKNLIKVNGILVMPLEEVLVKVKRTSETLWEKKSITPVNFANMILPSPCDVNKPQLLLSNPQPLSLQVICRTSIRQILLNIIRQENPKLKNHRIRRDLRFHTYRNGCDDPTDLLEQDPRFQMFLLRKQTAPFLWGSRDNDDEDDDNDDDNSSLNREEAELDRRELDESDQDMENDDEGPETKVKGELAAFSNIPLKRRIRSIMKRAHQTSTSNSDSETDSEDMECVEFGQSRPGEGESSKKTDNGDKVLKTNPTSESSMAESEQEGAGCSNNVNVGSSAESDDDGDEEDDDDTSVVRQKFRKVREMMVWENRLRRAKKQLRGSSDIEHSEDDSAEGKTSEPPNVFQPLCNSSYRVLMREKINGLPLPPTIRSYLDFHRTF